MSKKSLLLCTAAATILLFGTHYNLHAENLEVSTGKSEVSNKTYETIHAKTGGKIIGKNLTIIGDKKTNPPLGGPYPTPGKYAVTAEGADSSIELLDNTTLKGTDSNIFLGLQGKDGGSIKMIGGSIIVSGIAASFENSKSSKNMLENVTIAAPKDRKEAGGVSVTNSTLTLNNLTVGLATDALRVDNNSVVTVSGGSFNGKVSSLSGSTLTLKDDVKITTNYTGLTSRYTQAKITMTGGEVTAKQMALYAANGHITVTDVALKTDGNGTGAHVSGSNSTINLQNTTIEEAVIGLEAKDNGVIQMTGGSITVSQTGASFENNNNDKNKLENVKISSGNDGALMDKGISADKSTVTLKDVTVSQATTGIFANDDSTITVSGGSFDGKTDGVYAKEGGTITLDEKATVTSSEGNGLHAEGSGTKITKTGGTVSGKQNALFAEKGGQIDATDVALTTDGKGTGAKADDADSVITLKGTTTIEKVANGLDVQNGATAKMTGGSIAASQIGALFNASGSDKNKNMLENVNISNSENGTLMDKGISAEKSTVTLNKVTVTKANQGIFANDHSTITASGGSFEGKDNGVHAQNGSTITLKDNTTVSSSDGNGLHAEGAGSKITMKGGTVIGGVVNGRKGALFTENGGRIEVADVTLKTNNNLGNGASAIGPDSIIELKGKTRIENVISGLRVEQGGKITSENLTITIDEKQVYDTVGVDANDPNSEIQLKGNTTLEKVSNGLFASNGGKITSENLTVVGEIYEYPARIGYGAYTMESGSEIKLTGKTTIQNFGIGLYASEDGTIKMVNGAIDANSKGPDTEFDTPQNGKKNKIEAKEAALVVVNGGHIDLTDISATAEAIGLQFATFPDLLGNDPQKYRSNEINLTNAEIHAENHTGISVGAFVKKNIENAAAPSIGTVNLKKSEVHADVLLGDGTFWNENFWNNKDVKAITNGTFTLNADQSTLEGRATIAKDRNVHFDLKNDTTWFVKTSAKEKDEDGNL
ncbi:hypothetical protein MEI_01043, partial [Bartonella vinsonii subsp. arupensis Pm136co]